MNYVEHSSFWLWQQGEEEQFNVKVKGRINRTRHHSPWLEFFESLYKGYKGQRWTPEVKTSGAGTDDVYILKLPWFTAADSFLRDAVIMRKSKLNLVSLIF